MGHAEDLSMMRLPILMAMGLVMFLADNAPARDGKRSTGRGKDRGGPPSKPVPPNHPPRPRPALDKKHKDTKRVERKRPKKLTRTHRQRLMDLVTNKNLSTGEKTAIGKLLSGEPLTAEDRTSLSNLLANDRGQLTADDREAISAGISDDAESKQVLQTRKLLRLRNATGERLTVWVQYETLTGTDQWAWLPVDPQKAATAVEIRLEPGAVADVADGRQRVSASRIRIWAQSESGRRWTRSRDRDLWLVTEVDDQGEHCYYAEQMGTYTYSFVR
jgi:hypothetical protein